MRRSPWALALVIAFVAAPVAAACSFAERPPAPGAFFVHDPTDGSVERVDVWDRQLGATCDLSNAHALDADTFVYAGTSTLHVVDLATGDAREFSLTGKGHRAIAVDGDVALVVSESHDEDGRSHVVRAVDLTTGETERLPLPEAKGGRALVAGARAFLAEHGDGGTRVSVYDARAGAWVLRDRVVGDLGANPLAFPRAAGEEWLVLESRRGSWSYRVGGDAAHAFPAAWNDASVVAVDGEHAYFRVVNENGAHRVARAQLPDGPLEDVGGVPRPNLVGVHDGRLVAGDYSAPREENGGGALLEVPHDALGVPAAGVPVGVLAAALVAVAFRGVRDAFT